MFQKLGLTDKEIQEEFSFLVEAYKFGAPNHGGVALGLDRLVMILAKADSIRDVIAFPKNASAKDTMMNTPSTVNEEQLIELHIKKID